MRYWLAGPHFFTKSRWLIGAFRRLEDWCLRGSDAVLSKGDIKAVVDHLIAETKMGL